MAERDKGLGVGFQDFECFEFFFCLRSALLCTLVTQLATSVTGLGHLLPLGPLFKGPIGAFGQMLEPVALYFWRLGIVSGVVKL